MKKFNRTLQKSKEKPLKKPLSSLISTSNLLNLLPQILQILPKLNIFNSFFQKQESIKTPPQKFSENKFYALKTLQKHNQTVEKLKKKPN